MAANARAINFQAATAMNDKQTKEQKASRLVRCLERWRDIKRDPLFAKYTLFSGERLFLVNNGKVQI